MENNENKSIDERLREMEEKGRAIRQRMEQLDREILSNPEVPQAVKDHLLTTMKENERPEPYDGLMVSNRIVGYDPETFEPIYEQDKND